MRKLVLSALTGFLASGCAIQQPVPVILSEAGQPIAALAKPGMSCTQYDGSPLMLDYVPDDVPLPDGAEMHMRVQGGRVLGNLHLPPTDQYPSGMKCLYNMRADQTKSFMK